MDNKKTDKKIRVLTVIRHSTGGLRTYLKYTYNCLDRKKYHFTVLLVRAEEIEQVKADLHDLCPEFVEVESFEFPFVRGLLESFWGREVDIIHSQGYSCGVLVSLLNLMFGIPHIITLHGTFDEAVFRGRYASLKRRIIAFLLSRADAVNVVSEDAKVNLLEYFPRFTRCLSKIVVIENGIDVDWFRENVRPQKRLTDIEGIEEDSIVIGYLGRYMPEKGFPVLIDAIERLERSEEAIKKNLKVLALGWGAYIREYQALISGKALNKFFVFIEFQPDVRWVLRQIDVLVIPSLREAFPLIAAEGLVCGAPIIASDCIGLREALRGTPARLVKAGEPRELADAIIDMMRHPKKQEAKDFISVAINRFDVKITAGKLDSLFETLAQ